MRTIIYLLVSFNYWQKKVYRVLDLKACQSLLQSIRRLLFITQGMCLCLTLCDLGTSTNSHSSPQFGRSTTKW